MSLSRRIRRRSGAGKLGWGVVELYQPLEGGMQSWTAFWIQLGGRGTVSVEADFAERANNICGDAWTRARRAMSAPSHIVVLDEETARRVRAAVPASVPVVVDGANAVLRGYVDAWQRGAARENTHSFFN